jgi:hypothetical protein
MGRVIRLAALLLAVAVAVGACLPAGTRGTGGANGAAPSGPPTVTAAPTPRGPTPLPSFVAPTPTPAPTFAVYTVAKGDSLNTIARKYATTARSIAFWNRAAYPSLDPDSAGYAPGRLQVGWTLLLIPGLVYDEDTGDPVLPSGAVPAP